MAGSCKAVTTPDTEWNFCPNVGAAYALAIFFGITFVTHAAQGIYYRKWYTWVIVTSALLQFINYILRILSISDPASLGKYAAWFVLLLIAPLWTNAFIYMVLGRMVWNFVPTARIFGITAWRMGLCFVTLDIVAFIVQLYGAATASTATNSPDSVVLADLHVYMAGVGIQQLFILCFTFFAVQTHRVVLRGKELDSTTRSRALVLMYTVYAVLLLITVRIVFRLIEYSQGLDSTTPNHEVYQYCLDSLPMLLALALLNVVHPGRIMPGRDSDLPSRKQRKRGGVTCKSNYPAIDPRRDMAAFDDVEASYKMRDLTQERDAVS